MREGRGRVGRITCAAIVAALALTGSGGGAPGAPAWSSYGNGPERTSATGVTPIRIARGFVLPLRGRITGQVLAAAGDFFAASSAGEVAAFTPDGYVRWKVELGQLAHACPQLDGYGVTGTGVIDLASRTFYVADAFGRLHALALATGVERRGWPVRVFADHDEQLVWGALSLAGGAVYVPTASYCDSPMVGGIYRVDLGSRHVTQWVSVPASLGGGGGVWGWGGTAFSKSDRALYAVTANAFAGGSNVGDSFTESAGYGEHLVRLSPSLTVQAASHPADLEAPLDLDFAGSPVVLERRRCGELVVGADKDDDVYAWKANAVAAGPIWKVSLEPFDEGDPFLTQLAWSGTHSSLYAVTGTQLVRITIARDCTPRVAWRRALGTHTENGSPTVAGNRVFFAVNGRTTLEGYDARTGKRVFRQRLGGTALVAPTVAYNRIVLGTFTGLIQAFAFGRSTLSASSKVAARAPPGLASWVGSQYGFESRPAGVFATDDGGRSWREVYAAPATAVLRLSRTAGVIDVPVAPRKCMCVTRKLWTTDDGRTWHETKVIGDAFTGSAEGVYWWEAGSLYLVRGFPPRASKLATKVADGTIVAAVPIPGGVAALVSNRVFGKGWDRAPRVLIARKEEVTTVELPAVEGDILVAGIEADWPAVTVTGTDFAADPVRPVAWSSSDGGESWEASSQ